MQIQYCYSCNKRIEANDAVVVDDKPYCRPCVEKLTESGVMSRPPSGRRTSGPSSRKTPARETRISPAQGTPNTVSGNAPARSSKFGMQPATAQASNRPMRASGGNAIPTRASGGHAIPARASGGQPTPARGSGVNSTNAVVRKPSGGNSTLPASGSPSPSRSQDQHQDGEEPNRVRRGNSNALIWILAAGALLLAGIGAALTVGAGPVGPQNVPKTQPDK